MAFICEIAFIPPLITLFGLFVFVLERDKKATSYKSFKYSRFLLNTGPIIIFIPCS